MNEILYIERSSIGVHAQVTSPSTIGTRKLLRDASDAMDTFDEIDRAVKLLLEGDDDIDCED